MNTQTEWLKQVDMARSCDVSLSTFQRWNVEPVEKKGRTVFYRVADVLENRLADQAARSQQVPSSDKKITRAEREARLKLVEAQARGQQLKNGQLEKELAPIGLLEWVISSVASQIAALLESLPLKLKNRNPELTATDLHIISREIIKCQNICAEVTVDLDAYERNTN